MKGFLCGLISCLRCLGHVINLVVTAFLYGTDLDVDINRIDSDPQEGINTNGGGDEDHMDD